MVLWVTHPDRPVEVRGGFLLEILELQSQGRRNEPKDEGWRSGRGASLCRSLEVLKRMAFLRTLELFSRDKRAGSKR